MVSLWYQLLASSVVGYVHTSCLHGTYEAVFTLLMHVRSIYDMGNHLAKAQCMSKPALRTFKVSRVYLCCFGMQMKKIQLENPSLFPASDALYHIKKGGREFAD